MGHVDLLIIKAEEIVTLAGFSDSPATGTKMREIGVIRKGAIAIDSGKIIEVGRSETLEKKFTADTVLEAEGKTILPGFIDAHTHLIFGGSREEELTMKLEGVSYLEILRRGGGILKTVKATREASAKELVELAKKRLDLMLKHGVTTVEGKTGYGLNLKDEIKMLEAYNMLNREHIVDVIPTLLAAHAIPPEFKGDPEEYVNLIIEEIIPKVGRRKLAVFNDVFVEKGVFTYEQGKRILLEGKKYGLKPKVHADEINYMRGAELAYEVDAISADHLARASEEGIKKLSEKKIVAILLPAAPMVLRDFVFPNARKMIKEGVPVAIASDFNPNCWVENIQVPMFLATYFLGLTPAEVITAVTINAAHAIGVQRQKGSIEPGKDADLVIMDIPSHKWVNYRFGANLVEKVVKLGKVVVDNSQ